jgi:uncharacterized protein (TIGR02145 family)
MKYLYLSFFSFLNLAIVHAQLIQEIKIGNQIWMSENLNTTSFRNGEPIRQARNANEWNQLCLEKKPAWCYYFYDDKDAPKYGKLYNFYAVNDTRGLAPAGWHIPSDKEWDILINYIQPIALGGENIPNSAGKKMKSTNGWSDFYVKAANGDNSSGFNGFPGGYHDPNGNRMSLGINNKGEFGFWWSSSVAKGEISNPSDCKIWFRSLHFANDHVGKNVCNPAYALSIRCVKDGEIAQEIDSLALVKLLNIESKRVQDQNKIDKAKFDNLLKCKSTTKEAQFTELMSNYYSACENDPKLANEILNRCIKLMPVNSDLMTNKFDKEKASFFYLYSQRAKIKAEKLKDYNGALLDAKKCATIKSTSDNPIYDQQKNLRLISKIYEELGDIENAKYWKNEGDNLSIAAYNEVHSSLEKSNAELAEFKADYRYYCYNSLVDRYQLALDFGASNNVTYQLYNSSGTLIKTVSGKWVLQDEGVYGPAMVFTISFTGKNAGLPSMKFNAQYDGFGNLQGLIDSRGRIWNACR